MKKFFFYTLIAVLSAIGFIGSLVRHKVTGNVNIDGDDHIQIITKASSVRLIEVEKNARIDAWNESISAVNLDTKKIPRNILPIGYHAIGAGTGTDFYAVAGESNNNTHVDSGIWIFTKNWKPIGRIKNIPSFYNKEIALGWLNGGHVLGVIITANNNPGKKLSVGVIDFFNLQFRELYHATNLNELGTIWLKNELILFFYSTDVEKNRIIKVDLNTKKIRNVYSELHQVPARMPFSVSAVSPDGNLIAFDRLEVYGSEGSGIWLFDIKKNTIQELTKEKQKPYYHALPSWSGNKQLQFYRKARGNGEYRWELYRIIWTSDKFP